MPEHMHESGRADTGEGGDFEYDMAHEQPPAPRPEEGATGRRDAPVQVSTATDDDGRDYSYDLAHDIPRPEGPQHR